MDITEILNFASNNISGIFIWLIVGSGIIQLSPLKLNPWSYIARKLGKAINHEVIEKVDRIDTKINKLENNVDMNEAVDRRVRILAFNDQILRNERHSKDSFNQVLEDIDFYEKYCDKHTDFKNNRAVFAIKNIEDTYNKCMKDRDFL